MYLISVIVPVYNVEKYLDKCIRSIVEQTYKNLEIILVDDGSTDRSAEICDSWAENDSRIIVIHKENSGQGDSRNIGINMAKGNYIGFVDSDDFIALDMYEKLYNYLVDNKANAVQCAMVKYYDYNSDAQIPDIAVNYKILNPLSAVKELLADNITSTCPSMLLESKLAKSILFDAGIINEDVMWTYRVCKNARKFILTNEVLYFYLQRSGSTMNSEYSIKRFDALNASQMKAEAIKTDFPSLYPMAERNYVGNCFYHYQSLCRMKKCEEYEHYKKEIHKRFCKADLKSVYKSSRFIYKIWYRMFIIAPNLTCKIRNTLKIGL